MNIGMLLNAPYPADMRVRKEAQALIKAGFNVFLLCLRKSSQSYQEDVEGVKVNRIDAGKNNVQLAFWDIIMSSFEIHPKFKQKGFGWIKANSLNVLHVHDLPLVGTALSLRREVSIPVVVDFHENYPDALKAWFEWKVNPLARIKNKIFMNPKRWTLLEKKAVWESDQIIAVVEEMKDRLIKDYQVSEAKITVVTNTEELEFIKQNEDRDIYSNFQNKFIITYSGNIGPHRGVDTIIRALSYASEIPDIILLIVGSGSKSVMRNLQKLVKDLKLDRKIFFMGRQPFSKFYSFMRFASVNVIPHKSNPHTDNTVPHKLFQAMMVGRPVLVSSSAPLKRVVTVTHSGLVFKAGDPKDCYNKIVQLYNDPTQCKILSENGRKATIGGEWNWERTQKKLVDLYQSL